MRPFCSITSITGCGREHCLNYISILDGLLGLKDGKEIAKISMHSIS